ncbi:MAG: lytic transglycosylase domain-containing protein [Actinobacteria bacterium]|nr:lytic transglycosylase domain-containing protein [Actinomycetota bacterium]
MARRRRRRSGGRRILGLLLLVASLVALGLAVHQGKPSWYARWWYPLEHDRAINRDARLNGLDPALVAAVVWRESDYDPQAVSPKGAVGLMQLLPSTARFIESQDDSPPGNARDIRDPEVNISYGSWYLRHLIDLHDGSVPAALAAYNAGPENLRKWRADATSKGTELRVPEDVPFAETREYVTDVLDAWPLYRQAYGERLGPAS